MKIRANKYLVMFLGTLLMAIGVNVFFEPTHMVTGGVTGLAIIVKSLTAGMFSICPDGIPLWFTNLFLNIFLLWGSYKILGREFFHNTVVGTVLCSFSLYLIPIIDLAKGDFLLAAIFGGAFSGVGLGLVFSVGASTGGTDLLAAITHKHLKNYTVAQQIMVFDGIIVCTGALMYGINVALYAIVAVYITSKMMDAIMEGLKFAKMAVIISDKYKEIADGVLHEMRRGITAIPAKGMYSNDEKNILICAVGKKEITALMDIVDKNDPRAFMIVTDAREVLGEGFSEYNQ